MDHTASDNDATTAHHVKREIMWKYYNPDAPNMEATCKVCNKIVICRGGSTESLTNHLKYAHDIIIDKLYEELEHELNSGNKDDVGNEVEGQKRINSNDILNLGNRVGLFPPMQSHSAGIRQEITSDNQENSTETTYNCGRCTFVTKRQANWIHHVRRVHQKGYHFSCNKCQYRTTRKGNLKQHERAVHDFVKDFSCPNCYYKTSKKYNLDIHMQRVHQTFGKTVVNVVPNASSNQIDNAVDNLITSPKADSNDSTGSAVSNDGVESELEQCIEKELRVKLKKKPYVPPTDGWKRFMDSNPSRTQVQEKSKKESEGWRRFM